MRPFHLACTLFLVTASAATATTFSDLPFDQARDQAARDHKVLLVDFYTSWCPPCKKLDETTWPDTAASKLLTEKTIPLRLDAEQQPALAARYQVDTFPTVLLLRPDGTEIDRLTGYRDPQTFLADFSASLTGPDSVARARAEVANHPNNIHAHVQLADTLASHKRYPDALAEYLWCFDHGHAINPGYDGIRLARLPDAILDLAKRYPPARPAVESLRDARLATATPDSTDALNLREFVTLNTALHQPEKGLALLDSYPKDSKARPLLTRLLVRDLVNARRYQDVADHLDPLPAFKTVLHEFDQQLAEMGPKLRSTVEPFYPLLVRRVGLDYFEVAAATHRDADARAIATLILSHSNTPDTRTCLADRAARANNASLPLPGQK